MNVQCTLGVICLDQQSPWSHPSTFGRNLARKTRLGPCVRNMNKLSCAKMRYPTDRGVVAAPIYQAKAELFRTLGHPARIRILELLSERDHAVHELLELIMIEPSNLSQQLAVLRRAGLVVQRRENGSVVYSVSIPDVRDLLTAARRILLAMLSDQDSLREQLGTAHRHAR